MYEFEDDGVDVTHRKYYSIGGTMVAMREWVNAGAKTTYYLASDHLSSTSIVMDSSGSLLSENRYMPFGETRTISGTTSITETDFTYTGQRDYSGDFGLMDYDARFYSPTLGRFTQPDSVVPEPGNSQAWNRYSYVNNNPLFYIDPTGHGPYGPDKGLWKYKPKNPTLPPMHNYGAPTSQGVAEYGSQNPVIANEKDTNIPLGIRYKSKTHKTGYSVGHFEGGTYYEGYTDINPSTIIISPNDPGIIINSSNSGVNESVSITQPKEGNGGVVVSGGPSVPLETNEREVCVGPINLNVSSSTGIGVSGTTDLSGGVNGVEMEIKVYGFNKLTISGGFVNFSATNRGGFYIKNNNVTDTLLNIESALVGYKVGSMLLPIVKTLIPVPGTP